MFSSTVTADTFAVRYFRQSPRLQHLKSRIEEAARGDVGKKISELKIANAQYAELERRASGIQHTHSSNWHNDTSGLGDCRKCNIEGQQSKMNITVHKWPLPTRQLQAEVVVFELDCPVSFNMWRTATFHLLVDLCLLPRSPHTPQITLGEYSPLRPYIVSHVRSRFTLGCNTQLFIVSRRIPTTLELVCVSNQLEFYAFDSSARALVSGALEGHTDITKDYRYRIQSGPYHNLQKYVDATLHTSNEVVASQADCHADISLHEFLAFGHLRSGGVLQWFNILRELRSRSLSFRCYEVHFLLAQAVSQVGPLASTGWAWHQELQQPAFCHALLGELESLLRDVEANWLEAVTMDTVSFLLRRLLASSPDETVSLKVLELLRTIRSKVFAWVKELSAKLTRTPEDEEFRGYLRDCAAVCRSTYGVDPHLVPNLLNSADDVEVLLSSAMLIHDHTPDVSHLSTYSQLLLDRDRYLSLALEDALRDLLQADSGDDGIDRAILMVWHNYHPGSNWIPLQDPNSRWFSCTTTGNAKQHSQVVHFNLLSGSLLVDGKPLGRLSREILRHPLYKQIFGEVRLAIPKSTQPKVTDYFCSKYLMSSQVISQE